MFVQLALHSVAVFGQQICTLVTLPVPLLVEHRNRRGSSMTHNSEVESCITSEDGMAFKMAGLLQLWGQLSQSSAFYSPFSPHLDRTMSDVIHTCKFWKGIEVEKKLSCEIELCCDFFEDPKDLQLRIRRFLAVLCRRLPHCRWQLQELKMRRNRSLATKAAIFTESGKGKMRSAKGGRKVVESCSIWHTKNMWGFVSDPFTFLKFLRAG